MKSILIISADWKRPAARGKADLKYFVPIFRTACAERGFMVHYMGAPLRFLAGSTFPNVVGIIPIFNEELAPPNQSSLLTRMAVHLMEERARISYPGVSYAHSLSVGNVVADKSVCHALLSSAGIPMPPLAGAGDKNAISLSRMGTSEMVAVLDGDNVDERRHNVAFIDTRHEYKGQLYHVCLRAMCVGSKLAGLYVRARPGGESPSVHSVDTPKDAGLLNYLYDRIARPRREHIEDICARIGRILGVGFYAHDLLPEAATGRIYVCETGFKFDDGAIRKHLGPIAKSLDFVSEYSEASIRRAANLYVDQATSPSTPRALIESFA